MDAFEVNFDGIVGPTHNYSGLSLGNVASIAYQNASSNPKQAALQGLEKMWALAQLGIKQAVIPPHERPHLPSFQRLGYSSLEDVESGFIRAFCSSSGMWTANSATMAPWWDTIDGKTHITPANMATKIHRNFESKFIKRYFERILPEAVVHSPLPTHDVLADEGSANHIRFCKSYGNPGVHLFVWGRSAFQGCVKPKRFPARQTMEASQAVARLNSLPEERVIFAQQTPELIDRGVFHNDVISVGNQDVFLYYRDAFVNTPGVIDTIQEKMGSELCLIEITPEQVSVEEVIETYLFNSQLVNLPDQSMALIIPKECETIASVIDDIVCSSNNPISKAIPFNLKESMQNGGGPACLRLRVVLSEFGNFLLTKLLYKELRDWIEKHYREHLTPSDLADPKLLEESYAALDSLTKILQLGSLYEFQN